MSANTSSEACDGAIAPDAAAVTTTKLGGPDLIRDQGLLRTIREDYEANPRMILAPGLLAAVTYRYGTWTRTLESVWLRRFLRIGYWFAYLIVRNLFGIEMYDTVRVGRRLNIAHQSGIVIHLAAEIGDDCTIRQNVTFGEGARWTGKGPVIGDRVSFGPGTVLVGDVKVGDDVSIGPNCTITTNIPAGTFVVPPAPRVLPRVGFKRKSTEDP